jgi:hypothetical protein
MDALETLNEKYVTKQYALCNSIEKKSIHIHRTKIRRIYVKT